VPNFAEIGQRVAEIERFIDFFQYGGRPPSWIRWTPIATIDEKYLSIYIVVQSLKLNRFISSHNMKVSILRPFGLEMPIHATVNFLKVCVFISLIKYNLQNLHKDTMNELGAQMGVVWTFDFLNLEYM